MVCRSDGVDVLIDAGLITGVIALGNGNNHYVDWNRTEYGIELSEGDSYRAEQSAKQLLAGGDRASRVRIISFVTDFGKIDGADSTAS